MTVLSVFGFISGTKMSLGKEDWEILKRMPNESIGELIDGEFGLGLGLGLGIGIGRGAARLRTSLGLGLGLGIC